MSYNGLSTDGLAWPRCEFARSPAVFSANFRIVQHYSRQSTKKCKKNNENAKSKSSDNSNTWRSKPRTLTSLCKKLRTRKTNPRLRRSCHKTRRLRRAREGVRRAPRTSSRGSARRAPPQSKKTKNLRRGLWRVAARLPSNALGVCVSSRVLPRLPLPQKKKKKNL